MSTDERLRDLQRRAAAGDPDAAAQLARAEARLERDLTARDVMAAAGLDPDFARGRFGRRSGRTTLVIAEAIAAAQNAEAKGEPRPVLFVATSFHAQHVRHEVRRIGELVMAENLPRVRVAAGWGSPPALGVQHQFFDHSCGP